jgi:hypothetical protein
MSLSRLSTTLVGLTGLMWRVLQGKTDAAKSKLYGKFGKQIIAACVLPHTY